MNQGNNRGSGSDDRFGNYGTEGDDREDRDERRTQGTRQRQQEAYSGGDWLTHRQQGSSDWQGHGASQPGAGSDWQGSSGQQPGGSAWRGQRSSGTSSVSSSSGSSGYGGYESQSRRGDESFGEGRYGEYAEGRQAQPYGRDTSERYQPQGRQERERWGDWHQEGRAGRGSEWSSQQGSQRDEWAQGRGGWDRPARGGQSPQQGSWQRGRESLGRESGGRQSWGNRPSWGNDWEGASGSEADMRTHYRGGYGVSDYGANEPPAGQSYRSWQRRAASDWLDEHERRERRAAGSGTASRTGAGGYDPDERAYEHFTGASERSDLNRDLNRGYGGAGGSASARRVQRAGPKGYQRSDERIREDLCERLAMSSRVDVREVEVSVSNGVVTLSGTVQDRQQKYRIEDMTDDVFGVKDVHNQIRVARESRELRESGSSGGRTGASGLSQSPSGQASSTPSSAAGSQSSPSSTDSLGSGLSSGGYGSSGTTPGRTGS